MELSGQVHASAVFGEYARRNLSGKFVLKEILHGTTVN